MSASFEIAGYRGFKEYEVTQLSRVNLFVGKNNAGKTSILEAAQLMHSSSPLTTLCGIASRRKEFTSTPMIADIQGRFSRDAVEINHAFHGHSLSLGASIILKSEGIALTIGVERDASDNPSLDFGWEDERQLLVLHATRAGDFVETALVTNEGALVDDPRSRYSVRAIERLDKFDRSVFITPESVNGNALVRLYNDVLLSESEDRLVHALQILDQNVTGVYFLASDRSSPVAAGGGILIGRKGQPRIPIGSAGDGMRRLLALAMAFVNSRKGTLFIDEVDTGLHYSVMPSLWRLILGSSQELGLRSYCTTHSLDCIRGLGTALASNPELADIIAVHKIDGRLDRAVSFTGKRLISALSKDLELR